VKRSVGSLAAVVATVAILAGTPPVSGSEALTRPASPSMTPVGYDILFVRHAASDYAPPEEALNATGIRQAARLAETLSDEPIDSVYTSMMVRAFQTGDDVARDHGLPVLADADINEIGYDFTGVPPDQVAQRADEIKKAWLAGEERDNGFGGETYYELEERWSTWWDDFVAEHRRDRGTAVVVAHGGIFAVMLPATCANEVTGEFSLSHILSNTGMIRARLHRNGSLTCLEWNGTPVPSAP
jgi:broad specificity phosphatase PhoE